MRWSLGLVIHVVCLVILISLADIGLIGCMIIKWVSEDTAWEAACWIAESFWGYMQYHWESRLRAADCLTITGDEIPHGESAIVISNHLAYSDYYLVQALARRQGMLGRCRYFVKKEIVRIPFFGWAFWAIGMILVSRDWTSDAVLVEEAFNRVKRNRHDCWIILYPEGTRRTARKLVKAQAYAKSQGKQEYRHLLYPRSKGFVSTVQGLRDSHIQYLYDLTFLYSAPGSLDYRAPSLDEQLSSDDLARAGFRYRIHVSRIPLNTLPRDTDGLKGWFEKAWGEKDEWLEKMTREGQDEKGDL